MLLINQIKITYIDFTITLYVQTTNINAIKFYKNNFFEIYQEAKSYKVPFLAIECLHTLKLIHSIYASIELNRKVELSENLSSSKLGL